MRNRCYNFAITEIRRSNSNVLSETNNSFLGLVRMRFIESDENLVLRGSALEEAIKDDIKLGLIPFWVSFFDFCSFVASNRLRINHDNATVQI